MATDNFTDDDGTSLTDHDDGVTGVTWASVAGSGSFDVSEAEINNNVCEAIANWQQPAGVNTASDADESEIILKGGSDELYDDRHAAARMNSGSSATDECGYGMNLESSGDDAGYYDSISINKDRSWLSDVGIDDLYAMASDHTIKITISGTTTVTIECFIDDVSVGEREDSSSPLAASHPGFYTTQVNEVVDSRIGSWTDNVSAGGGAAPTGVLYGPLIGCLGGPV